MKNNSFRPDIRVRLIDENPFFGPGTADLLRCIKKCGSIAHACMSMDISYSKGRTIIRCAEEVLGHSLVYRTKGGPGGGQAEVSRYGERVLEIFERYEEEVKAFAKGRFTEVLEDLEQIEGLDRKKI